MSRGSYSSFFSLLFSIRFQGRFGGISCCTARVSTHLTEPSDFSGSTGLYPSNVRDGWRGIFISFGMRERLNDGDMRIWNSVSQLFFFRSVFSRYSRNQLNPFEMIARIRIKVSRSEIRISIFLNGIVHFFF